MIHVTSTIVSDAGFAVVDLTEIPSPWLYRFAWEESGGYRLALVEARPALLERLRLLGYTCRLVDQPCDFGDEEHGRFRIFMAPDEASNGEGGPWYLVALDDEAREALEPGLLTPSAVFGAR